ncbi:MAG: glutamate-cysteine ligase family protein [Acidimicrobiales bacterium]
MPARQRTLDRDQLAAYVADHVFGGAAGQVADACDRHGFGIELEFLTGTTGFARLTAEQLAAALDELAPLATHGRFTIEPGGQFELSSRPEPTLAAACEAAATDLFRLVGACRDRGIELVALGADPTRPPERVVTAPRYRAMQAFFDAAGAAGRTMMCNTASVQLNVGLGHGEETMRRWRTATAIGPVLLAAFANSPFTDGGPSGWQSTRQRAWWALDPSRSSPVPTEGDPVARWLTYALHARVMLIRRGEATWEAVTEPLPFEAWLDHGHDAGWPTLDDFAYHLTTLFPPVRPKGWFELRYLDALPTPFWHVAAAVSYGVMFDEGAGDEALRAASGTEQLWVDAAQLGLGHPALRQAAPAVFAAALEGLERLDAGPGSVDAVATFLDRWAAQGRSPADDLRDRWRATGRLVPDDASPVPYADGLREVFRR